MKNTSKSKLEKILSQDLNNYENMGFNDECKTKALTIIGKEASILQSEEKQKKDFERNVKSSELEREKFEFDKEMREKEYNLNKEKLDFEKSKQIQEINVQEQKMKHDKIQLWVSIGTAATTALISLVRLFVFTGLTVNAQKHDYNDYQLESPSSKENRNNLLK